MFEGKNIVIFGAHPDDIELGMGGTLNQIKGEDVYVTVFADTAKYNGKEIIEEYYKSMESLQLKPLLRNFEVDNLAKDLVKIREEIYKYKHGDIFLPPPLIVHIKTIEQ